MQVLKNVAKELAYIPSRVLCRIGSRFPLSEKEVPLDEIERILVVYSGGSKIGDVALSTAAIRALRKRFPAAHVAMLVNTITQDVVMHNPRLNEVFVAKHFNFKRFLTLFMVPFLKRKNFDLVVLLDNPLTYRLLAFLIGAKYRVGCDYEGNGFLLTRRAGCHQMHEIDWYAAEGYLNILRSIGIDSDDSAPEIFVPDEVEEATKKVLLKQGVHDEDLKVCIHPGSGGFVKDLKRWPNENFARLGDALIEEHGVKIIFISGPGESWLVDEIVSLMKNEPVVLSGETGTVMKLAGVIKSCDVLVCHDSAPMHIGAAVGTPTVTLFGPTKAEVWAPKGKNHIVMKGNVSCSPCYDTIANRFKYCKSNECMNLIRLEEVEFNVIKLHELISEKHE